MRTLDKQYGPGIMDQLWRTLGSIKGTLDRTGTSERLGADIGPHAETT